MMKTLKSIGMALIAILVCANFVACSDYKANYSVSTPNIVGTWVHNKDLGDSLGEGYWYKETLIFDKNGTFTQIHQWWYEEELEDDWTEYGTYKYHDTVLNICYNEESEWGEYKAVISGDTLSIYDGEQTKVYQRHK